MNSSAGSVDSSDALGLIASHAGGSIQSGFMTSWRTIRLQSNLLRYMLVGSRFLFVCPFPPLQVPNFKTPAVAYERDFILQSDRLAKFVRQNQATLTVCAGVLSARMQLTQEHAAIARGNLLVRLRGRTHFRELLWRHNQQKLVCRLRQKNEVLRTIAPPTRRNRNPILIVYGMPELASVEAFGLRIGVHRSHGAMAHFTPLDPTFNHLRGKRSIKIFSRFAFGQFASSQLRDGLTFPRKRRRRCGLV